MYFTEKRRKLNKMLENKLNVSETRSNLFHELFQQKKIKIVPSSLGSKN